MAAPTKKYGLINLKKEKKELPQKKASIFDDSDSDEDGMVKANKEIMLASQKNKVKRQTQMEIDKAMADDPTVYAYDDLYDDMKRKEKEAAAQVLNQSKGVEKKSRYITGLLKASEKRKKEHERREEKKVQKEREAEGDEFNDKEKFVTSAYKKKMAEMAKLEEEEQRREKLESMMDVTKQADMNSFYRGLYNQTLGSTTEPKKDTPDTTGETPVIKNEPQKFPASDKKSETKKNRSYRRQHSESDEEISREVKRESDLKLRKKDSKNKDDNSSSRHRRGSGSRHRSRSRSDDRKRRRSKSQDKRRTEDDRRRRSRSREHKKRQQSKEDRSTKQRSQSRSPEKAEAGVTPSAPAVEVDKYAKRNDAEAVMSAKERYLARKAAKLANK